MKLMKMSLEYVKMAGVTFAVLGCSREYMRLLARITCQAVALRRLILLSSLAFAAAGCDSMDALTRHYEQKDIDCERKDTPRTYVLKAVNSEAIRVRQGTLGNEAIEPWALEIVADANIADAINAPGREIKCRLKLEHSRFGVPVEAEFVRRRKAKPESVDPMRWVKWERVQVPVNDGWTLSIHGDAMDSPTPEALAVMIVLGAYFKGNYPRSAFGDDGTYVNVVVYEKEKTISIDISHYAVDGKRPGDKFKNAHHGEINAKVVRMEDK